MYIACTQTVGNRTVGRREWDRCPSAHRRCFSPLASFPRRQRHGSHEVCPILRVPTTTDVGNGTQGQGVTGQQGVRCGVRAGQNKARGGGGGVGTRQGQMLFSPIETVCDLFDFGFAWFGIHDWMGTGFDLPLSTGSGVPGAFGGVIQPDWRAHVSTGGTNFFWLVFVVVPKPVTRTPQANLHDIPWHALTVADKKIDPQGGGGAEFC